MTIRYGNKDGGIENRGKLWIENCAISQNSSIYKWGGINCKGPLLSISQSTINENLVKGDYVFGGGGIFIDEGRHYKRLAPVINVHQEKVDNFLEQYWAIH